ncbi:MAG: hypothetical protein HQL12_06985 [Candidatus Omnitrophica bacterium]|nr:hypothetical protein [Candidatus Omnitrophota bacterium]
MSARFCKIFLGVFLVHLVVIRLVWVGFSAPGPRLPARFTYEGELPAEYTGSQAEDVWQKDRTLDQFAVDHLDASDFNHWIGLRDPSKPLINL